MIVAASKQKIKLTPNQEKVIKDKYLRNAPSPQVWLEGVAHNIALSELMFHPKKDEWKIFEGIDYEVLKGENGISNTILFHSPTKDTDEREANFAKVVKRLEELYKTNKDAKEVVKYWETEFFNLMSSFQFLPNSPTLMNAGRDLQQLSACYVLPVPDSIDGIAKSLHGQSLIQKSGGGTGFSFSQIRPKGDIVKKTHGVASGALSFMQLFDKMTDVVKQGGTRRGANMGVLDYTHPEVMDFIRLKHENNAMENFNISVAIDKKFLDAAKNNKEYDLINPNTKKACGKMNAKKVFDALTNSAWKSGDPGVIFIDRINDTQSNPTPELGQIESTNPCGEQPLLPWEPCNLASINIAKFVRGEITKATFDFDALEGVVKTVIRFLDNVIEINNYPLAEIEKMAKTNRRIGLGVMGLSETFVHMGVGYDTPEGLELAEKIMKFINDTAMIASEALAKERGIFPNFKNSVFDEKGKHFRGEKHTPRNAARTTIAPTGTIAITAGLQGSGIEPFFAIAYTRYNAKALEALKDGKQPDPKDTFFEVNPLFKQIAEQNKFFGLTEKELWQKIEENHKAVRGIKEIPAEIQKIFPTSHDVSIEGHIKMQAAFQRHIDNAVSKTVNMSNAATVEDVSKAYIMAHELGCKGITIYRDGCKEFQVLNLSSSKAPVEKKNGRDKKKAGFAISSHYYQIETGYGPLHVHINYDDQGPFQVFTNIP
ncbi:MAG: adenosylcobalamin-dependent ribonucleoside-diphosphate reductase, partial [Elusimicrobiaceae bacterium]|nr:adenosylcobalamin-dependent ribonucleoside-diphosphate reductase [Elusimicrobiaceae bacterium]